MPRFLKNRNELAGVAAGFVAAALALAILGTFSLERPASEWLGPFVLIASVALCFLVGPGLVMNRSKPGEDGAAPTMLLATNCLVILCSVGVAITFEFHDSDGLFRSSA